MSAKENREGRDLTNDEKLRLAQLKFNDAVIADLAALRARVDTLEGLRATDGDVKFFSANARAAIARAEEAEKDSKRAADAYYEKDAELARCEGALDIARRSSERWYKRCRSRAERIDRFREALDRIAKGPHLDTCSAALGAYPCDCHLSVAYAALFPDRPVQT